MRNSISTLRTRGVQLSLLLALVATACSGGDSGDGAEPLADQAPSTTSGEQSVVTVGLPCSDEPAEQDTFYVAPGGDDAADGRTPATAWRTLDKVAASGLPAGSQLLLASSSVHVGSIDLAGGGGSADQPTRIGAYCDGAPPVISGFVTGLEWTDNGDGTWQTTCGSCREDLRLVTVDGGPAGKARWPNADEMDEGYVTIADGGGGAAGFTDPALAEADWTGGEFVVKSEAWILDVLGIISHSGDTIALDDDPAGALRAGYGYFIQNHPGALDRDGEWVWDAATATLTVRLDSGTPADRVRVGGSSTLLRLAEAQHVVVDGIELTGTAGPALDGRSCASITLLGVTMVDAGAGALFGGCSSVVVRDTSVVSVLDNGLDMQDCTSCQVTMSELRDIALVAGLGGSGDGHYMAARIGGPGFVFADNVIADTGYTAINIDGEATVERNVISRYDLVKVDGGGVYTFGSDEPVTISDNLIFDGGGSLAGIPWSTVPTHGVYIDDGSSNVDITANRIVSAGSSGIKLHNVASVRVVDNTVAGHGFAQIELEDDDRSPLANTALDISDNRIVALEGEFAIAIDTNDPAYDLAAVGSIDRNLHCNPYGASSFDVDIPSNPVVHDLAGWQTAGFGASSSACPIELTMFRETSASPNVVPNPSFDTDEGWFVFPEAGYATHDPAAQTMLLGSFPDAGDQPITLYSAVGSITADSTARLRFTVDAQAGPVPLTVQLGRNAEPFGSVGPAVTVELPAGMSEQEVLLTADDAAADGRVSFVVAADRLPIVLTSVSLEPVEGELRDPDALLEVITNPTDAPLEVTVEAEARQLDGSSVAAGTTVLLEPRRVLVLFDA